MKDFYNVDFHLANSWPGYMKAEWDLLDLYQEKKLLDLNYICSGGMREGMPLIFVVEKLILWITL